MQKRGKFRTGNTMKIIFAGTPEIATALLLVLLQSKYEVIAVYTQPDRPAGRYKRLHTQHRCET